MSLAAPTIDSLLAARHAACLDRGGVLADARARLPVWRKLWRDFAAFIDIRDRLVRHAARGRYVPRSAAAAALLDLLVEAGLMRGAAGHGYAVASAAAEQLLRGAWLEELGACAADAAGADEVRFSQRVTWQPRNGGEAYHNEIDVLARCGERLAFVSCKALAPWAATDSAGDDRIFDALKEVAYWRAHFGAGAGQAILLTTVDFIDEPRRMPRNGALLEQAAVLGVTLVSADIGDFDGLVAAFRRELGG